MYCRSVCHTIIHIKKQQAISVSREYLESSRTITEKGGYAQLLEQSAVAMKFLYLILVSASNQIFFLNKYKLKKLVTINNV